MEQAIATVESAGATPASAAPLALVARALDALTSLKFTIVCLILLMVLVVACTLAQVDLGTFGAVNAYIRSLLVWCRLPGTSTAIPIFPGGGLVGLLLTANLAAAQLKRLERSRRKIGIWVVHAGLILLFAGEFVTALAQVDVTDPRRDDVHSIPESLLAQAGLVEVPGTPVVLDVKLFFRNAELTL